MEREEIKIWHSKGRYLPATPEVIKLNEFKREISLLKKKFGKLDEKIENLIKG